MELPGNFANALAVIRRNAGRFDAGRHNVHPSVAGIHVCRDTSSHFRPVSIIHALFHSSPISCHPQVICLQARPLVGAAIALGSVSSSRSSPTSFDASTFKPAQRRRVVQMESKVDALGALRQEVRRIPESMQPETVDGGYDMQISARLVFLQGQLSGPLTRARRGDAPMSRSLPSVIRPGSIARQGGLAVRRLAEEPPLSDFDIDTGGAVSVMQYERWPHMEAHRRSPVRNLAVLGNLQDRPTPQPPRLSASHRAC